EGARKHATDSQMHEDLQDRSPEGGTAQVVEDIDENDHIVDGNGDDNADDGQGKGFRDIKFQYVPEASKCSETPEINKRSVPVRKNTEVKLDKEVPGQTGGGENPSDMKAESVGNAPQLITRAPNKAMILRWVGVVMPGNQVQLPLLQRTDSDEDEEGEIDGELQEKYPF
ncbi:hypothetical protein GBF38_000716, partial [Nibea albiflora]